MNTENEKAGEREGGSRRGEIVEEVLKLSLFNALKALEHTLRRIGAPADTIAGLLDGDLEHVVWWVDTQFPNPPPSDGTTWRNHILGPDDLIPMANELQALREANILNIAIARLRLKRPNDPHEPWCMAVVERNGIEYFNDQYPSVESKPKPTSHEKNET